MPTTSWCCARDTWRNKARTRRWSPARAGTRASGAINNCRRAWMPTDTIAIAKSAQPAPARTRVWGEAAALLVGAAAPERRLLLQGVLWLLLAAGLEALGPIAGKTL